MARRAGQWFVALALALSLGAHWLVLQSAAWTGMFVSFVQTDSVATALSKTFDGRHACNLCIAIREGRHAESRADEVPPLRRLEMANVASPVVYVSLPRPAPDVFPLPQAASLRPERPPVPPPRFG